MRNKVTKCDQTQPNPQGAFIVHISVCSKKTSLEALACAVPCLALSRNFDSTKKINEIKWEKTKVKQSKFSFELRYLGTELRGLWMGLEPKTATVTGSDPIQCAGVMLFVGWGGARLQLQYSKAKQLCLSARLCCFHFAALFFSVRVTPPNLNRSRPNYVDTPRMRRVGFIFMNMRASMFVEPVESNGGCL